MKHRPWIVLASQFVGLGWYIVTAIIMPTMLGLWLDNKLDTSPVILLIGLFLGLIVAFYGAYRMASTFISGGRHFK